MSTSNRDVVSFYNEYRNFIKGFADTGDKQYLSAANYAVNRAYKYGLIDSKANLELNAHIIAINSSILVSGIKKARDEAIRRLASILVPVFTVGLAAGTTVGVVGGGLSGLGGLSAGGSAGGAGSTLPLRGSQLQGGLPSTAYLGAGGANSGVMASQISSWQSALKTIGLFSVMFASTYFLSNRMTDLYEFLLDPNASEREKQVAVMNELESLLRNKTYLMGLSESDVAALWNDYKSVCALLGVEPIPFPQEWFVDEELDTVEDELELYRRKLEIAKEFEEPQLSPYDITTQQQKAYLDSKRASEAALWDDLPEEIKASFVARGITRERYLAYQKVVGTVSQDMLDQLFPEFMDAEEAIEDSLKYSDVMEWIMGMDDTTEPKEYEDLYEGSKEFDEQGITPEEFYGLVSGERYRKRRYSNRKYGYSKRRNAY